MTDFERFDLGDFPLASGVTLPAAKLAYKTFGTLNAARDNVIVLVMGFNGQLEEIAPWMGQGLALDPERYFIIACPLIGNGQSSSPSNTAAPFDGPRFPKVTVADNVRAQHRLVTQRFGITRLKLVTGFSMGGLQTYEWAAAFPDMVERIAPICGAARCARHNYVFLASLKAALTLDPNWNGGDFTATPVGGLKAFGRIYAGWAFSQAFYRAKVDMEVMGFASAEAFLEGFWDELFQGKDGNDLLCMLWTWQHADIGANPLYGGDFDRALAAITARAVVMPSETDLYFPVADSAYEVERLAHATLAPIPSIWGHVAGNAGANKPDTAFMDSRLRDLLEDRLP